MVNCRRTDGEPLQPYHRICQLKDREGWWRIVGSIREIHGRFVQADLDEGKTKGRSWRLRKDLVVEGSITTYGDWQSEPEEPREPVADEVVRVAKPYREQLERIARTSPGDTFSAMLGRALRRLDTPPPQGV